MAFIRNGGVYVWVHTSNVQYTYTTVGEYVENGKHIYNHAFIEQHCNSAKNTSLSAINDAKQSIYVGKTIYASDGQKLERILNLFINHNHMRPDIGGTYGIFTCWHLSFGNKYGVGNVNIGARAGSPISSVTANAGLNNSVNRINRHNHQHVRDNVQEAITVYGNNSFPGTTITRGSITTASSFLDVINMSGITLNHYHRQDDAVGIPPILRPYSDYMHTDYHYSGIWPIGVLY